MSSVGVLVVDDSAVVRAGLRGLLESSSRVHVVGEAWDGDLAVELTRRLQPDVVLLDVRMPRRDGVSAAREIAATSTVLMMTFTDDPEVIREAVDAGAAGYLVHGAFDAEDLVGSVVSVARGSGVFSGVALEALRAQPARDEQSRSPATDSDPVVRGEQLGLSPRQAEIMSLIAEGMTNGEIAARCFLSEKTVKNHINRIFAAIGVRNRAEAVALWLGGRLSGAAP